MVETRIYLVRHGAHDWLGKGIPGRAPIPLNEAGKRQANFIAQFFEGESATSIYTSPQLRAVQTANATEMVLELYASVVQEAAECDFGDFEGHTFRDLASDPDWIAFNNDRAQIRAPGGESLQEVAARMIGLVDRLVSQHQGASVILFGHNDPLRVTIAHYLTMKPAYFHRIACDPGSIACIRWSEWGPQVTMLNYIPHGLE